MITGNVLARTEKMHIEFGIQGDRARIRPVGVIDEDVNFSVLIQAVQSNPQVKALEFELNQVSRMNSCGVREWILLMEKLGAAYPCSFLNVGQAFIEQLNVIPNFFGKHGRTIETFEAPYHCTGCSQEVIKLLRPGEVKLVNQSVSPPQFHCDKCKQLLEFDSFEDEYFDFIKRKAA